MPALSIGLALIGATLYVSLPSYVDTYSFASQFLPIVVFLIALFFLVSSVVMGLWDLNRDGQDQDWLADIATDSFQRWEQIVAALRKLAANVDRLSFEVTADTKREPEDSRLTNGQRH